MPRPVHVHDSSRLYFPRDTEFAYLQDTDQEEQVLMPVYGRKSVSEHLSEAMIRVCGSKPIKCVNDMVAYLREGDFKSALITRQLEYAATQHLPSIEVMLKQIFGCYLHGVYKCHQEQCDWCLWLEDQWDDPYAPFRNPPAAYKPARSSLEAMRLVKQFGVPSYISFDHDLGLLPSGKPDTSMVFLTWLSSTYPDADVPEYRIHSANFIGRMNIQAKMESWKKSQLIP